MKIIFTTALVVFISLLSQAQQCLIGSYDFTGNVNDASGNLQSGIVNGATLTTDRNGNANSAYNFDGQGSYIEIPHDTLFNGPEFTIAFWARTNDGPSSTGGGMNVNPASLTKVPTASYPPPGGFYFYEIGGNANLSLGTIGGTLVYGNGSNINFTDGNWHLMVLTYKDNDSIIYYLDNQIYYTVTGVNIGRNTDPIRLGTSNSSQWKSFNGDIDDVKLFSCKLTSTDVLNIYNGSTSGVEENEVDKYIVFPTLANEKINVDFSTDMIGKRLQIIDMFGRKVIELTIQHKPETLNTIELPNGFYFVKVNSKLSGKFIITH